MLLPIRKPTGEFPRYESSLLPDNAAQTAIDCDFVRGTLAGLRAPALVAGWSGAGIRSMFVYEGGGAAGNRFWWNRDVDALRSPVVSDAYSRFYWADGTGFYVSRGDVGGDGEPTTGNRYKVGVPRPASAPAIALAAFAMPGVTAMAGTLFDEATDGTLRNETPITLSDLTRTAGAVTYAFTAREPVASDVAQTGQQGTVSAAASTAAAPSDLWPLAAWLVNGAAVPTYQGASGPFFVYYNDPAGLLPSMVYAFKHVGYNHGDNGTDTVRYIMYRCGNTYWYASQAGAAAPTPAGPSTVSGTNVTVLAPVKGPLLKLRLTMAAGGEATVSVRPDGATDWPSGITGYTASLKHLGGNSWQLQISTAADQLEHRAYVYTYVNQYGEEGPPSDPVELDCEQGAAVTIAYALPPADYCPITRLRVYRTATGKTTAFLFAGDVTINTAAPVFTDQVKGEALGESLATADYAPPPQTLRGLCLMGNGIMAGFTGNEVHFSEPYLPYAWNPKAIKPFANKIMGLCPVEGGLYVTTTAEPYLITGAEPLSMTDARIPAIQAGVSKGSICSVGPQVAYATRDGIVLAQGMGASLDLSMRFFTRADWLERYGAKLSLMRFNAHDGALVVWFSDGTPGFMVRIDEDALSMTRLSDGFVAAFVNPVDDTLYVSLDGASVQAFRASSTRQPFDWTSKRFAQRRPTSFGALQLVGTGTVDVEVMADGVLSHAVAGVALNPNGSTLLRLPSGFLARDWSLRLKGQGEILEATFATLIGELRGI